MYPIVLFCSLTTSVEASINISETLDDLKKTYDWHYNRFKYEN